MGCYDCEECSKSIEYGGKCKRFEYNCPFVLIEQYKKENLNEIRTAINRISESIDKLKSIDDDCYMEDEISSIECQISLLKDKTDENIEMEWQEINK